MLGKALDFNGFRNYCGFRGSGPPASPRSTASMAALIRVWTSMLDGESEETSSAILLFAKRVLSEKGK